MILLAITARMSSIPSSSTRLVVGLGQVARVDDRRGGRVR
jgi:hypothetical protein